MSSRSVEPQEFAALFPAIDFPAAAARLAGQIRRTPLLRLPGADPRIEVRGKMENLQETGAFKARGAWNNLVTLTEEERARGVVAASSGNHGRALAWAARRAGVQTTIVMPADAYPNKIAACREEGAAVVLAEDRHQAEQLTAELQAAGRVMIHPYDRDRTIEGAGTVGLEIAEDWPEVEVVLICVGGGGLAAGASLALRRALGARLRVYGVEPEGAPTMQRGLAAGQPVTLESITTAVQGLCPPHAGVRNIAICRETLDGVWTLPDAAIECAQRRLVQAAPGWEPQVVEPAGACAYAAVLDGRVPEAWLAGRSAANPLRVAVTISGGNPDPAQLAAARAADPPPAAR